MRYIKRTSIEEIKKNYDIIVGWGNSVVEFERFYNPSLYKLDYLINGQSLNTGEVICGCKVYPPTILNEIKESGKKICFIIFPNIEVECTKQIELFISDADTIVGRLIDCGSNYNYASDVEDIIIMDLLKKLDITDPYYMDIGVCHPIIRNNTYLMYERGNINGVLVEPNPVMVQLAKEYRSNNKILNLGVTSTHNSVLPYVSGKNPGLNHFKKFGEVIDNSAEEILNIPVLNINHLLEENSCEFLDVLDIDIEGMDFDVLDAIDYDRFKIKIICAGGSSIIFKRALNALVLSI